MSMIHNDIFNLDKDHEHNIFSIIEFYIMEWWAWYIMIFSILVKINIFSIIEFSIMELWAWYITIFYFLKKTLLKSSKILDHAFYLFFNNFLPYLVLLDWNMLNVNTVQIETFSCFKSFYAILRSSQYELIRNFNTFFFYNRTV